MAPELGGSQISALLESVPGIARVLRSPVADALVNMIRAGAGLGAFDHTEADELIQYAVRRGLISAVEGDGLTAELGSVGGRKRAPTAVRTSSSKPKKTTGTLAKRKQKIKKKPSPKRPVVKKPQKKAVKRR